MQKTYNLIVGNLILKAFNTSFVQNNKVNEIKYLGENSDSDDVYLLLKSIFDIELKNGNLNFKKLVALLVFYKNILKSFFRGSDVSDYYRGKINKKISIINLNIVNKVIKNETAENNKLTKS